MIRHNISRTVFILVFFIGIALPYLAISQDEKVVIKERTLSKRFDLGALDTLALAHSFGDAHISTWDKNEVAFEIKITGTSNTVERSQNIVDNVFFEDEISTGSMKRMTFRTKVATPYNNNNGVNGREVRVDLIIHIPAKAQLDVYSVFGDVYLGDFTGYLKLKVLSGTYHIQHLVGPGKRIQLMNHSSSPGGTNTIASIEEGQLSSSESGSLIIGKSKDITVWGYDSLTIDSAESVSIYRHSGFMNIGSVGKLYGKIETSYAVIGELRKTAELTLIKCGNVTIRSVGPDFNVIDISATESGFVSHIADGANFEFDIKLRDASIYRNTLPAFLQKNEQAPDSRTQGTRFYGMRGNSSGSLIYNIEGGSVSIY